MEKAVICDTKCTEETTMTARDNSLNLLIEYGIVDQGTDVDEQIFTGVVRLLESMVMNNRKIISLNDEIFRLQSVLDSAGITVYGRGMN